MTQIGQSQEKNSQALNSQASVVKKKRILENIAGGIGNVQFWLDELRKILEEETKENTKARQEPKE